MSQANNGSIPKFSKYSGVVQWNNAYFLWVNITPSNLQKKSNDDSYPNEFLENGKMMTWFGGSLMRPGKVCYYHCYYDCYYHYHCHYISYRF